MKVMPLIGGPRGLANRAMGTLPSLAKAMSTSLMLTLPPLPVKHAWHTPTPPRGGTDARDGGWEPHRVLTPPHFDVSRPGLHPPLLTHHAVLARQTREKEHAPLAHTPTPTTGVNGAVPAAAATTTSGTTSLSLSLSLLPPTASKHPGAEHLEQGKGVMAAWWASMAEGKCWGGGWL